MERERATRHQAAAESQVCEQQQLHISRLTAANEVLQDRLRVVENKLLEADKVNPTCFFAFRYLLIKSYKNFSKYPKLRMMLLWKTD